MVYFIGVEFFVNLVGELLLFFFVVDLKEKVKVLFVNVQGVLEQYCVKEEQKMVIEFRYRFYKLLSENGFMVECCVVDVKKFIRSGNYEEVIEEFVVLMKIGFGGFKYFQRYDWLFL